LTPGEDGSPDQIDQYSDGQSVLFLGLERWSWSYAQGALSADEKVVDRLFEGEEAVLHVMGRKIGAPERPIA